MLKTYLLLAQSFKRTSERLIASKAWPWNISIYTYVFLIFVSFPSYELFFEPNSIVLKNWHALNEQCLNPLRPNPFDPNEHEGQIAFRVLLPGISHLLGLKIWGWFVVQHLLGFAFMAIVARHLQKLFKEPGLVVLAYGALAFTYVFRGFWMDVIGYFDATGWFLILMACLARSVWAFGGLSLASCFVDERCLMSLPLVVLYHIILRPDAFRDRFVQPYSLKFVAMGALVLAAVAGIRWYLTAEFGLANKVADTPLLGFSMLRANYRMAPLILLTGLDFLLPAAALSALIAYRQKMKIEAVLLLAYLVLACLASLIVLDVTRATAYLFPGALLFYALLSRYEPRKVQVVALGILFTVNFVMPPLFAIGDYVGWMGPMVPKLAKLIFGVGL